ncbi:MAG: histidine ammonia-lyase, partial [Bacteroidia bacterium]
VKLNGKRMSSKDALQQKDWFPLTLKSKEGLALLNGTQFMLAYGIYCVWKGEKLLQLAHQIAALSIDGFDCKLEPFQDPIHRIRPHKGQGEVARQIRLWLSDSEIATGFKSQVQDPYSFRCIPQVHGACQDALQYVKKVMETEFGAATDNPNIFPDEGLILSGGNFHGQPLAMALDYLAIVLAEIGSISERRTYQLISGQRGLPPFLTPFPGLNSGLMIPQYTAASIVSQNKQLCTPASVDTIPSSNNQEDHVSMGANAATKCFQVLENLQTILAIELINASQAVRFREPAKTGSRLQKFLTDFRKKVPFIGEDRYLHEDMQKARAFIEDEMGVKC